MASTNCLFFGIICQFNTRYDICSNRNPNKQFYNISTTEVNALAIVCSFIYTPGTILSIWLSRKFSIRIIMIIGSVLNLGVFIRLFSLIQPEQGYAALMIGQILAAISAPFFLTRQHYLLLVGFHRLNAI